MRTKHFSNNGFLIPRIAATLLFLSAAGFLAFYSFAADPPSGTLSAETPELTYTTGPNVRSNPSGFAGTLQCNAATICDDFDLTVDATGFVGTHNIQITASWQNNNEDYDMYIHQGQNPPGAELKTSASSSNPEIAVIDAVTGLYTVRTVPFAVAGGILTVTIKFVLKPVSITPLPPGPGTPRYHNFAAPGAMGNFSGEPTLAPGKQSLGGRTMFLAGTETLRLTWNDCSSPASGPGFPGMPEKFLPLWEDKSFATTSGPSLDPILFGDFVTGRTFVSQLGPKTSFLAFTDNDGGEDADTSNDYTPSQGSGINSGVDHQTIGGGPYKADANPPPPPHPLYENAIYYASQDSAVAQMARSDTGGATFAAAVPMYNLTQCGGLHGHIKVTPANAATLANGHAGTVYVPNKSCGTTQGVVVSEDNGVTFQIRNVPGSLPGDTDPSIGIDAAGNIYFAFADGDGGAKVAVSSNKGVNWSIPVDVGLPFGIKNTVFAGAVGGDAGRATVMYLATDTPGAYQETGVFEGVWHIYASSTFDGGANWTTVRVSPENDPVQRGSICTGGLGCMGGDRNLLDFNDVEIDHEGRVIIAYADGCVGCTSATGADSRAAKATIARQSGGQRMLAAFDPNPAEPLAPASPRVDVVGEVSSGKVHLAWSEPDNGGSPLTGYRVYRRTEPGAYGAPLATVTIGCPSCKTTYDDTTAAPGTTYFYKVTALNAIGESGNCGEFPVGELPSDDDPCVLPGVSLLTDPALDSNTVAPPRDILEVFAAEIYDEAVTANKLFLTMKVGDLNPVAPPESRWTVFFTRVNPPDKVAAWGETTAWFVTMTTQADEVAANGGTPPFFYGHVMPGAGPGGIDLLVTDGTLDAGSQSPDGSILFIISTPAKTNTTTTGTQAGRDFPALQTGENLTNVNATTQQVIGVLLLNDDSTGNGAYTLAGNGSCRPNAAPIAALTANPTSGQAPLLVSFDASGSSDADFNDLIVSYTFNFGDGSAEVTQATPMIQHTYSTDGNYLATVRVTDSRGKQSENPAQQVIIVTQSAPSPTPSPSATPTATPTATPANVQLLNISGRVLAQGADKVGIGGFIITGPGTKRVMARAIGPSMKVNGTPVQGRLQDPYLELHDSSGSPPLVNDDWRDLQEAEIQQTGLAPTDDHESAIVKRLPPGNYTAIIRGADGTPGIGLVELYDLSTEESSELGNLSVRADVGVDDNVLIDGVILSGGSTKRVLFRALGPSVKTNGTTVPGALSNPEMDLFDANGTLLRSNDNWPDAPNAGEITATGLAPLDNNESAILLSLGPGNYTAVVRGVNRTTGISLAEAYKLNN